MYDILKKALDEALTEKYNAELMSCTETDYSFSGGFISDMKTLIRKTDNKLIYYSKYVAIAACACVAVGCAVLLPNLLNSDIAVQPSETTATTATVITTVTTDVTPSEGGVETSNNKDSVAVVTTVIDEAAPVLSNTEDDDEISGDVVVTTTTTVTTKPPVITSTSDSSKKDDNITEDEDEGDEDIIIVEDEDDDTVIVEEEEAEDEEAEEEDYENGDIIVEEEEEDVELEEEEVEEGVEDEAEAEEEEEFVEEEEEFVEEEEEVEEDVDEDIDEDDVIEVIPVSAETLNEAIGLFLWDDKTKDCEDKVFAENFKEVKESNGVYSSQATASAKDVSLDFINDYLYTQKNAPRISVSYPYWGTWDYISVVVADIPVKENTFGDYSKRNEYDYYFGGDETEYEIDEEEEFANTLTINISDNGYIWIEYGNYETVAFDTDDAATSKLFDTVNKIYLTSEPKTVGDILRAYNVTAETMTKVYGVVAGVYDLSIYDAHFDTDSEKAELIAFLNKIKDKKFKQVEGNRVPYDVIISLSVTDCPIMIDMRLGDNKLYIDLNSNDTYYATDVTDAELEELITLVCRSENISEPFFYRNLEEYLANAAPNGVKLTKLENAERGNGTVTEYYLRDEKLLAEIYTIISTEFKNAEYKPYFQQDINTDYISGELCGKAYFRIEENDTIQLLGNDFMLPEGTYKKVYDFIRKNAVKESYMFEEEYEEIVDEEEIEE